MLWEQKTWVDSLYYQGNYIKRALTSNTVMTPVEKNGCYSFTLACEINWKTLECVVKEYASMPTNTPRITWCTKCDEIGSLEIVIRSIRNKTAIFLS